MKKMKKIMCLLLAVVMVMGMSMTVFAADLEGTAPDDEKKGTAQEYTITIPADPAGHTYEIYQIFTGDVDSKKVLSNVKWGLNGTGTTGESVEASVLEALEAVAKENENDDKAQLEVIEGYVKLKNSTPYATLTSGQELENVPAGYYLIKDKDKSLDGKEDEAYTLNIVQIVGPIEVKIKADKPTVDKEVSTVKDEEGNWLFDETADHAINETFQFKLTATVPAGDNIKAYDEYKLVFTDTMSDGVTFDGNIQVKAIIDGDNENPTVITGFTTDGAEVNEAGITWSLTIADLKSLVSDFGKKPIEVVVTYDAHLNEKAIVHNGNYSGTTNYNKVGLEYTNNPNNNGTGKTKEDYVWVFSFKVDNNKVDENKVPLVGAGFRLYSDAGCTEENEVKLKFDATQQAYIPVKDGEGEEMFSAGDNAIFNIKGLKAGTYYLKETTTPEGYNTCDVIQIDIVAEHSENVNGDGAILTLTKNDAEDNENGLDSMSNNLDNTVENKSGSTLPETGGIGTTIFYVLGGILVLGCGVILVTRKRVSK